MQSTKEAQTTPQTDQTQRTPSVRKLYLNKRAVALRESFQQRAHNISNFVQEVQSSTFNATRDELLFAQCLSWMQENLFKEANIIDLAAELKVSVRKIQRLFSFFLSKTYTSVLLDMRIETAKHYLSQHKNTIGEVGFMVGIKDHAYFTYLFRKTTGMTPSEYRLSLIQQQVKT